MHEAQIRVAIAGAGGRMGRQLIQAAWRFAASMVKGW